MALKRKITKVEYDKLSDELKKAYKAGEYSDTFVLDLGDEHDDDDPEEMRRALAREREDRKKAQKELKALKEKQGEADDEGEGEDDGEGEVEPPKRRTAKRASEDAAKIDRDWKKRFDKTTNDLNTKLSAKDAFIKKALVGKTAEAMAAKISTSPRLLAKAIAERLTVDFDGDEPELVILDSEGKPASISLEKLEKEFVANKEYASIIIGSKASGGGAPKTGTEFQTGGGAPASEVTDLSKLSAKNLAATLKARKEAMAT